MKDLKISVALVVWAVVQFDPYIRDKSAPFAFWIGGFDLCVSISGWKTWVRRNWFMILRFRTCGNVVLLAGIRHSHAFFEKKSVRFSCTLGIWRWRKWGAHKLRPPEKKAERVRRHAWQIRCAKAPFYNPSLFSSGLQFSPSSLWDVLCAGKG